MEPPHDSCDRHLALRDLHFPPVEPGQDEPVEALVVGAAVIAQDADRLPLADAKPLNPVRPIMLGAVMGNLLAGRLCLRYTATATIRARRPGARAGSVTR
jgi:hypothetical protein